MIIKIIFTIMVVQVPDTTWTKTFGGAQLDDSWAVKEDNAGNFIIAGWTLSYGSGLFDGYIIKTDYQGNMIWEKTFGGSVSDAFFDIEITDDGNYIFAGYTKSFGAGGADFYIVKTDTNGNEIWSKTYGGAGDDYAYAIEKTQDGGFIIAGYSNSFAPYYDIYIVKINSNGDTVWTSKIGGPDNDYARDVICVSDGYVICGWTQSFGAGNDDVYVVKVSLNGDSVWAETYGGAENEASYSIVENPNGEFVITGYTESFGAGLDDVYFLKIDSQGNLLGENTLGGVDNDRGWEIINAPDGGYVIAGNTVSYGSGNYDVYIVKTDESGNELWYRAYGGTDNDHAYSIDLTQNLGYIVSGGTRSFGAGNGDVYLLRLSSEGIEENMVFLNKEDFRILLSPAQGEIKLQYIAKKNTQVEMNLFDFTGRFIRILWKGNVSKGKNLFRIPIGLKGSYLIQIKDGRKYKFAKFVNLK